MDHSKKKTIRIAAVGCLHGKLKVMYENIMKHEMSTNKKIDLVVICGDFQSLRSKEDLNYIKIPDKYKEIGDFHRYYNNEVEAPYMTIFIGGNHEASNFLNEIPDGGFVCKNIYYMGRSGIVNYMGLRIGGISGIFNMNSYYKGYYEKDLLNMKEKISIYHTREFEIAKMNLNIGKIDLMLSHDWPYGMVRKEDYEYISKIKRVSNEQIEEFGSPAYSYLIRLLKPKYWISAHLHLYYTNTIEETTFLALDKIITEKRKWLEVIEIEVDTQENNNSYDEDNIYTDNEWISIYSQIMNSKYIKNDNQHFYGYSQVMRNKEIYEKYMKEYYFKYYGKIMLKQVNVSNDLMISIKNALDDICQEAIKDKYICLIIKNINKINKKVSFHENNIDKFQFSEKFSNENDKNSEEIDLDL